MTLGWFSLKSKFVIHDWLVENKEYNAWFIVLVSKLLASLLSTAMALSGTIPVEWKNVHWWMGGANRERLESVPNGGRQSGVLVNNLLLSPIKKKKKEC